jgi:hypothetical protein
MSTPASAAADEDIENRLPLFMQSYKSTMIIAYVHT